MPNGQSLITEENVVSLNFSENNPNTGDVAAIGSVIDEFGFLDIVVAVDPEGERRVLAGEHRIRAAINSGIKVVPVFWLETDSQGKDAYMLGDNEIARHSTWDLETLSRVGEDFSSMAGTTFDSFEEMINFAETKQKFGSPVIRVSVGDVSFEIQISEWTMWETELRAECNERMLDAASVLKERLGVW